MVEVIQQLAVLESKLEERLVVDRIAIKGKNAFECNVLGPMRVFSMQEALCQKPVVARNSL